MNADKSIKCWLGGGGGFSSERLCQLIKHSHYLTILKAFSDNKPSFKPQNECLENASIVNFIRRCTFARDNFKYMRVSTLL